MKQFGPIRIVGPSWAFTLIAVVRAHEHKAKTPGESPVALREKTTKDTDGRRTENVRKQTWGMS
jgi:hypothetical protein